MKHGPARSGVNGDLDETSPPRTPALSTEPRDLPPPPLLPLLPLLGWVPGCPLPPQVTVTGVDHSLCTSLSRRDSDPMKSPTGPPAKVPCPRRAKPLFLSNPASPRHRPACPLTCRPSLTLHSGMLKASPLPALSPPPGSI